MTKLGIKIVRKRILTRSGMALLVVAKWLDGSRCHLVKR